MSATARFSVGELVQHRLFDYRGVVVDVDPEFMLSDEWYKTAARSRPPKDRPWYRVLVDGAAYETYVAERNLDADQSRQPVDHPQIGSCFERFAHGRYLVASRTN